MWNEMSYMIISSGNTCAVKKFWIKREKAQKSNQQPRDGADRLHIFVEVYISYSCIEERKIWIYVEVQENSMYKDDLIVHFCPIFNTSKYISLDFS